MKLGLVFASFVVLAGSAGCSPVTSVPSASATPPRGHTEPPGPVYRFDFTINASEGAGGAGESDRHYSMVLEQGDEGRTEAASNVPLGPGEHPPRIDAGVNMRCKYELDGDDLLLHTVLTLSSAGTYGSGNAVHKVEMIGDALVAPGKPALVATVADPSSQSRYELRVAATRVH